MYQTFTLQKTSSTAGGTYTDIVEFNIDPQAGKAIVAKACHWERVLNGEQDNGSDLFGQETVKVWNARAQYAQFIKLGYAKVDAQYFIAEL